MATDEDRGLRKFTVSAVTTVEGIESLRADYEQLQGVTRHGLPFSLHEWHLIWCRHILNRDPHIVDEIGFCVLRKGGRSLRRHRAVHRQAPPPELIRGARPGNIVHHVDRSNAPAAGHRPCAGSG